MAIRVRHAPAASVVARGGYMGGLEDLRRHEQQVAIQQAELAMRANASSSAASANEQARLDALAEAERNREFTLGRDKSTAEREITRQDAEMARVTERERLQGEQLAAKDAAAAARLQEGQRIEEEQRIAEQGRKDDAENYKRARAALNFQGKRALAGIDAQRWTLGRSSDLDDAQFAMAQDQLNKDEAEILGNPMFQADEPNPEEEVGKRTMWMPIDPDNPGVKVPVVMGKGGVPRVVQGWKPPDNKGEEKQKDRDLRVRKERMDLEVKLLSKGREGEDMYDEPTRARMLKQFDDLHGLVNGMPPPSGGAAAVPAPAPPTDTVQIYPLMVDAYLLQFGDPDEARAAAERDGWRF